MPKYEHFEDLPVWQEAARLYNLTLDLLDAHGSLLSPGYRSQLDRAALSVSNNIAEGFDRITTNELISFLGYARGSASEVKSMGAVIAGRPAAKPALANLQSIRTAADSCIKQLSGWMSSIEESPVQGKRHLTGLQKREREAQQNVSDFRQKLLLSYKPTHPLYNTPEARRARGEAEC